MLRQTGYSGEAKRVVVNTVILAMVSDCLHHIYEALRCMEKRKVVVAHNLFRKPLMDSLGYLSWILADEGEFYDAFTSSEGSEFLSRKLANRRLQILEEAINQIPVGQLFPASAVYHAIFDRKNATGLYGLFQHAIHLVTAKYAELETTRENFNLIFKRYSDNDLYDNLYGTLPRIMLYLSHVIMALFNRMKSMDSGARDAFEARSFLGIYLVEKNLGEVYRRLDFLKIYTCTHCRAPFRVTAHNAARLLLSESYRCVRCRRVQPFPFAWLF